MVWFKLPKLEKECEREVEQYEELNKRVSRASIAQVAISMLGGGHVSIEAVNREISANIIANRSARTSMLVGIEDSGSYNPEQINIPQVSSDHVAKEAKMWRRRKMLFYPIIAIIIAFN
ncbi:Amino_acid transporter family protein [Hexamita inflata]|uniref:Amino acid transporter family protein n=1 Tax=Hexamita inflata TaxID=28002 RepID=A0AA86UH25_9EUKA|nr:Amino acid transporter family protein [Hexamita inflata]